MDNENTETGGWKMKSHLTHLVKPLVRDACPKLEGRCVSNESITLWAEVGKENVSVC